MANTGNVFPGTGENNAGIGATAWTGPGNVVSDNGTDATCNAAASSQYLVARNFDFSTVPIGATINGIVVRLEASEHSTGAETLNVRLQNATAALVGTGKTASISGNTKTVYTLGTTSDTWAASPTAAMIHDPDFGVRFWFTSAHDVRIDYVTMAIEYTSLVAGMSTETDTAFALTGRKIGTFAQADETDAALELTGKKIAVAAVSVEADEAFALEVNSPLLVGMSEETDTAFALVGLRRYDLALSEETDEAFALDVLRPIAFAFALEVDEAFALEVAPPPPAEGTADPQRASRSRGRQPMRQRGR